MVYIVGKGLIGEKGNRQNEKGQTMGSAYIKISTMRCRKTNILVQQQGPYSTGRYLLVRIRNTVCLERECSPLYGVIV